MVRVCRQDGKGLDWRKRLKSTLLTVRRHSLSGEWRCIFISLFGVLSLHQTFGKDMKQNTKDWIQHLSAVALILSAITMGFVALDASKNIGAGPLTYIGETLSASLALFGISAYVVGKVGDMRQEMREQLELIRQSIGNGTANEDIGSGEEPDKGE